MADRLMQVTIVAGGNDFGGYQPGEIGKVREGLWLICCPICKNLGKLRTHQVAENEDGTITISPSLVCNGLIYKAPHDSASRLRAMYCSLLC